MWLAHYLSEKKGINKLLIVSFFVYLVVNLFENLIHYTIGKFSKTHNGFIPPPEDWIRIIIVMIIFAGLQGLLTCYFTKKC
jgi:hypothetical protein